MAVSHSYDRNTLGAYTEYLEQQLSFEQLTAERKVQLRRIAELRGGRDVLVYAADMNKGGAPISIDTTDLLPINDQLANLSGSAIDVILETPGGSGETAEDIVRLLHHRYDEVGIIVPGVAKSAGTILAMAGDEILMEPASALGPIDAQIQQQGKVFSADALLEGMNAIKAEVERTGSLNKAYIPMLQGISPGELQGAENALMFAQELVTDWLARYKFKNWTTHASSGAPVTDEERTTRAKEIAAQLCDHTRWKTHARSIKIADLEEIGLEVTDYSNDPELADAIRRYNTLMQMTFATSVYKMFETADSQIFRFAGTDVPAPPPNDRFANVELQCHKCGAESKLQANLVADQALQDGFVAFPADNKFDCPSCGTGFDLADTRRQVETEMGRPIVG